jgi:hypothetical protein
MRTTNLLQLLILQVVSDHHLQNQKQLAVADETVPIDVVDLERKVHLLLFVALGAERAESRDKLLEIDIPAAVLVEYGNHACGEGVRVDLWQGEKLVFVYRAISILLRG